MVELYPTLHKYSFQVQNLLHMEKMGALGLSLKTSLITLLCQQQERVGEEEIWSTVLIPPTANVSLKVSPTDVFFLV